MPRRTKKDALETRERILDAAEKVFDQQGFPLASLAEIARDANVTRGAIYWHFKDKRDLFDAVCARTASSMTHMADAIAASPRNDALLGRLRAACLSILQEAGGEFDAPHALTAMLRQNAITPPANAILLRRRAAPAPSKALLKRLLEHAVKQDQLPADLDVDLAGTALHGALSGLLDEWLSAPGSFDLTSRADRLLDVSVDAMRHAAALRKIQRH